MSTKIYTGFKIASNMPFYVLHQQLMDFRAEIAKEVERKALQTLITISVFDMDKRVIGLDDGLDLMMVQQYQQKIVFMLLIGTFVIGNVR